MSKSADRREIINQILAFPGNPYSREYLDGPHPRTKQPYSVEELSEYLDELRQAAAKRIEAYRQEQVSFEFLARHAHDFNKCAANIGLIKDYFAEHHLDWTPENLETAFVELKPKFAPVTGAVITAQPLTPEPPPVPDRVVKPAVEPLGLSIEEINSWDGPTMRQKMANPVTRKQIDAVLAAEAELQRLARQQDARQRQMENQ